MGSKNVISNCRKATLLSMKKEEAGLSWKENIYLRVHMLFCLYCKRFMEQSRSLNEILQKRSGQMEKDPPYLLSDEFKDRLHKKLGRQEN